LGADIVPAGSEGQLDGPGCWHSRADCAGATLGLDGAITNPLALVDIVAIGKLLIADSK